jgi:hypothetical protein
MPRQLTHAARHHVLDNNDNFSPDDRWLVYDERAEGIATNAGIGRVELATGRTESLYREEPAHPWGPGVGAANYNPAGGSVDFIRGLTSASAARPYAMWRRTGVAVGDGGDRRLHFLDARDVTPPYTPGALRGGTHRHEWSDDGEWIGFTYNDAVMVELEERTGRTANLRTIGVAARLGPPIVVRPGPENHDGEYFAVVAVAVTPDPRPGTDEVSRAFEDAWVGRRGYRRSDGSWQRRARAFLGSVRTSAGDELVEVFVVDLPDRLDVAGPGGPLEGTETQMPSPPAGTRWRRLTFTAGRRHPGVALEPRHWVRSSADGTRIVFLAHDDAGIVQALLVSPNGGAATQVTRQADPVASCVRWSPDGSHLLYVCAGAVTICDARPAAATFGTVRALTAREETPPFSPVWSHDGRTIAYNRLVKAAGREWVQIFTVPAPDIA